MKIGMFDSGIGGTTVLEAVKRAIPEAEYVYIADSENCPYGEKDDETLWKIVCKVVENLLAQKVDIIVVACNTVTTRFIDKLRKEYPEVAFVGTEPAIKHACNSGAKNILVMGTPGTISSERTKQLVKANQRPTQKITLLPCAGLASAIEKNQNIETVLDGLTCELDDSFDAVVLACTHYPLIKDLIQQKFPSAKILDGNDGIARQVLFIAGLN